MRIFNMLAVAVALALPASVLAQQPPSPLSPPDEPGTSQDRSESALPQPGDIVDDGMVDDVDNPEIPSKPVDEPESAPQRPLEREAGYRGAVPSSADLTTRVEGQDELVNYLAAKLYLVNQAQIEMAEFASQNAEQQQVKQFATQIRDDHQALNRQLMQAMPGLSTVESLDAASSHRTTLSGNAAQQPSATVEAGTSTDVLPDGTADLNTPRAAMASEQSENFLDGSAQKLLDLQRSAIETNHQLTQQMLSEKQGRKFDMCFVASQMGANMWMHAELQAISNVGPQQLTEIVQQADSKIEQHLQTAKQLGETLKSNVSSSTPVPLENDVDDPELN